MYVLEDIRPGSTSYKQSGTKKGVVENIYPPDTSCVNVVEKRVQVRGVVENVYPTNTSCAYVVKKRVQVRGVLESICR